MRAGRGPRSVVGLRGELTGSRGRSALPDSLSGFAPRTPRKAPKWFPRSARPTGGPDGLGVVSGASIGARAADARRNPAIHRANAPIAARVLSSPAPRARTAWLFHVVKTYVATPSTRERNWLVVDANGQTLGRLATQIADALRGKTKPEYTPHCDTGDFVVVVNAEKIAVTGNKRADKKYYRHS